MNLTIQERQISMLRGRYRDGLWHVAYQGNPARFTQAACVADGLLEFDPKTMRLRITDKGRLRLKQADAAFRAALRRS